jgi:hypothetical protein
MYNRWPPCPPTHRRRSTAIEASAGQQEPVRSVGVHSGENNPVQLIATHANQLGGWIGLALAAVSVSYVLFKLIERRRVYRSLRVARIAPLELKQRIESGESITIVDLRNTFEWREGRIPGSLTLAAKELDNCARISCPQFLRSTPLSEPRAPTRYVRPAISGTFR